jgi:hypothetical protein
MPGAGQAAVRELAVGQRTRVIEAHREAIETTEELDPARWLADDFYRKR